MKVRKSVQSVLCILLGALKRWLVAISSRGLRLCLCGTSFSLFPHYQATTVLSRLGRLRPFGRFLTLIFCTVKPYI